MNHTWTIRNRSLNTRPRPLIMGIVNVTPDSFSDGGRFLRPDHAIEHGLRMVGEGADILDLGAESTRPGADPVAPAEQIRRLRPVVEGLRERTDAPMSIDTASAEVARAMLDLGADIVNDVTAMRGDPDMADAIAESGAGVCLMHMLGTPRTMQKNPRYRDAIGEIRAFLAERIEAARASGVAREAIVVDPGIGFGKTVEHNLTLIARADEFDDLGRPLLYGVSRKSFIGKILDAGVDDRLEGAAAAVSVATFQGAGILRVHDVQPMRRVADLAAALRDARTSDGSGVTS